MYMSVHLFVCVRLCAAITLCIWERQSRGLEERDKGEKRGQFSAAEQLSAPIHIKPKAARPDVIDDL